MIRSPFPRAFTLIEMLTVMLVIAILAGLVLSVNGLVQTKAARARAEGEIKSLGLAAESYATDNGSYPRSDETDLLDPRDLSASASPTSSVYQRTSRYLYIALSGDANANGRFDEGEGKSYASDLFKPSLLNAAKDGSGVVINVNFIKDPFDNSYGYSTAGAKDEEDFIEKLRREPRATRPANGRGFNPTFDLWSTGGSLSASSGQAKWVKNW